MFQNTICEVYKLCDQAQPLLPACPTPEKSTQISRLEDVSALPFLSEVGYSEQQGAVQTVLPETSRHNPLPTRLLPSFFLLPHWHRAQKHSRLRGQYFSEEIDIH